MTTIEETNTQTYKGTFSLRKFFRRNGTQLGIFTVFVLLWGIFIVSAPETFLSPQIYYAFMSTIPFFAIVAMPLTITVIAGEIDLSFPAIMAIGMVAFLLAYDVTPICLAWFSHSPLLIGLFAGWLNGIIIVHFGIPSLVATIGTQFFWRGAVLVLSQGKSGTLVYTKETLLHPILVGKVFGVIPMQMVWLIVVSHPVLDFAQPHSIWRPCLSDR